jgi:quinol-cytochrome oxidoreductase complex cytochrome b subunit
VESSTKRRWLKAIPIDIEKLYEQIDEALPHSAKRWWWCWGGIVGLLFFLQIVTGLLLAFYYRSGPEAYPSISFITEQANFGNFLRSVHQWGATLMIVFLFLHMVRVFVTGAFRDYRWGAWMAGVALLGITFGMGFTGYALVSDQLSYWGLTVTSNIVANVPLIGDNLKLLFLAGEEVNPATLSRMYALHVQILPVSLVFLVLLHLFFVRLMGMYIPGAQQDRQREAALVKEKGAYHFYPDHALSEATIFLYLVLIICLLALIFPATLGPPADPMQTPEHIKPEWYFYPFFHLLKLVPGPVGVGIMGLLGLCLFFWPVLDHTLFQKIDRMFNRRIELSLVLGILFIGIFLIWAVTEANL